MTDEWHEDWPPVPEVPTGFERITSSNAFGRRNGPIFEKAEDSTGGWVRGFRVQDHHINSGGVAHGGMLMTFADIVLARAVLTVAPQPFVTVRLVSDFIGPAFRGDWVEGRAFVSQATRSLVFVDGRISCAERPVLSVSGVFKRLRAARKPAA